MPNNEQNNSHKLIFTEIKERLRDQFDSISSLDTKAGISLALIGAFLAGLVNSDWFLSLPYYYLLPPLITLVLATLYALRAILARDYGKDPEPSKLIDSYGQKAEDETLRQLTRNLSDNFDENQNAISTKKHFLNTAFVLLFVSVLILSMIIFLSNNSVIINQLK